MPNKKHIVLLGFKHVGKSTVGKLLAEKLALPFIDLDTQIEQNYQRQTKQFKTCREIYQQHGELFFRDLETASLRQVIEMPSAVIALGGGALRHPNNQMLIKPHWLVHLTAQPELVYARIMAKGKPAYFPADQAPEVFFQHLWEQYKKIYTDLAHFTVENNHSATQTAEHIFKQWSKNP